MSQKTLPEELVWAEGGHASDIALSTLADGQAAILPDGVLRHVHACASCTQHLGHAALLSLHVARELDTLAEHERALVTARRPLPRMAIALGLAVAVLALVPSAGDLGSFASLWGRASVAARVARTVAHAVLSPSSPLGVLVTCGTAAALVVSALVVVKLLPRLPRKEVSS
jgi:hypothetical protein